MSRHRRARAPRSTRVTLAALLVAALSAVLLLAPATSGAYVASIRNSTNTVGSAAAFFTCDSAVAADKGDALFSYTLAQTSGSTTAADTDSGAYPGTYRPGMTSSATTPKACPRDAGGSWLLNGTNGYLSTPLQLVNPTTFSTEIWFKTTVAGGKLFSFNSSRDTAGSQYDRHTYIGANGRLVFGIYNSGVEAITSPNAVNDGAWHHVVSTLSPSTGMSLWLDGVKVAGNTAFRSPENTTGYWKIGYDTLGGSWTNVGPASFSGSLRYAAVYSTALTATQIQNHYSAGR
ncbi:LamG domain-containing protein [Rathayibacter sp. VKM Ac-2760]|uniref:LamG domain-containing protein n=1 Tax=Rathayibacter sp. VKM Ac-2760 TaxID=2609253 RepID=UPI001319AE53|nr:LamG domain-containing protein [Rathayibacter sp. VKM Ac-2760]QHC57698.1 LamG domain-containing protein [Rathayibacter sp. VKM Ac-2760]